MSQRQKVLCVDDEPGVLDGLTLTLRRRYEVLTAPGGQVGLQKLETNPDVVVILSDMRMPQMDGAAFLERSRAIAPDAARILLTGYADLDSAVQAVNLGQIFRFLQKPSSPATILAAVEAGVVQNRLVTAEKVLLEQTLHGAIKVLTSVLALVSPSEFGHGTRLKRLVSEIAERCGLGTRWQVEVAAMLLPLANLASPEAIPGMPHSTTGTERGPAMVAELLSPIPRLEEVRTLLESFRTSYQAQVGAGTPPDSERARQLLAASILKVASDFDELESAGESSSQAIETMSGREGRYAAEAIAALVALRGQGTTREIRELQLVHLKPGMVFAEDVKTAGGMLLIARGHEVTPVIIERLNNYPPRTIREPLRVYV
jgi:response regulator RpfG family c-di-GMP phosphodiesterase